MKRLFDWFTNAYPGYNIVIDTDSDTAGLPGGFLIHITDFKAINFSYFIRVCYVLHEESPW